MILVLKPDATKEQFDHIVKSIEELGFTPHISKGQHRTIIGAVGDENIPQAEETFNSLPGVEQVSAWSWFQGVYKEPKNFFARFGVDADVIFDLRKDWTLPVAMLMVNLSPYSSARSSFSVRAMVCAEAAWPSTNNAAAKPRKPGLRTCTPHVVASSGKKISPSTGGCSRANAEMGSPRELLPPAIHARAFSSCCPGRYRGRQP